MRSWHIYSVFPVAFVGKFDNGGNNKGPRRSIYCMVNAYTTFMADPKPGLQYNLIKSGN